MNAYRMAARLSVGITVVGCMCCGFAAFAGSPPPLRIVAEHYPPYEYMSDGVATGINVEVTSRIMKRLGVPFEYAPTYPFPRAWALVRSGNAEAVASVSCQPQRAPYVFCTPEQQAFNQKGIYPRDYLWMTRYVFFVHKRYANALKFESYEQLRKDASRIGVLKDYAYDRKLLDAGLKMEGFISSSDAFKALIEGDIDLFPMDETVGRWMLRELKLSDSVTTLPGVIFEKPYLMMFAKKSSYPNLTSIWTKYYEELRKLRDSGEYADIVNRYLPPDYPYPLPRSVVFVGEEWAPFEYLKDEKPAGINVAVLKRVMGRLNVPYEVQLYPWSRAWMLAERGRADAVLSVSYKASREHVLCYTPEQREFATTGALPPDYLWMSEYVFFVKKSRAENLAFESYEQIKRDGYRVGTNKDYSYCPEFMEADLSVREYPDTDSGMTALISEDIDLYPMDRTVGQAELRELGLSEVVTFIPKPLFSKPYLCPFVKGSSLPGIQALMQDFNRQLRRLRSSASMTRSLPSFSVH
jgi:polar amino acid transport system substrate-binding protein